MKRSTSPAADPPRPARAASLAAGLDLASLWLLRGEWSDAADVLQETLERASDLGEPSTVAAASQLLAMVDRLCLRPAAGRTRWPTARTVRPLRGEIKKPSGVAARGDAEILVSDEAAAAVLLIDSAGELEQAWNVVKPGRPYWGPDGEVSVEGRDGLTVLRSGDDAAILPTVETEEPVKTGILNRARGAWRRVKSVVRIAGGRQTGREDGGGAIDQSLDTAGRWWVLGADGSVTRLAADGTVDERLPLPPLGRPAALAIDPLGNFYLLDRAEKRIEIYDREGRLVVVVGPTLPGGLDLARPEDLAVDHSGRLFIADSRRGVLVLE